MKLLARARGLQERIRPVKLASCSKRPTFRPEAANAREDLLAPKRWVAPASKLSTREAGRIILNLLHIGGGGLASLPSPKLN